jgi:protein-S-isoprenylcysteine O-methyltransferase Ste14
MTCRIPPLLQLVLATGVGWFLSEAFPLLSHVSRLSWIVGWILVVTGLLVSLIAVGVFRRKQTTVNPIRPEHTNALVTTGLYAL